MAFLVCYFIDVPSSCTLFLGMACLNVHIHMASHLLNAGEKQPLVFKGLKAVQLPLGEKEFCLAACCVCFVTSWVRAVPLRGALRAL